MPDESHHFHDPVGDIDDPSDQPSMQQIEPNLQRKTSAMAEESLRYCEVEGLISHAFINYKELINY